MSPRLLSPTAVFCGNDIMAMGTLYETDLRVPQDISLIGYDGVRNATPALTLTISQKKKIRWAKTAFNVSPSSAKNRSPSWVSRWTPLSSDGHSAASCFVGLSSGSRSHFYSASLSPDNGGAGDISFCSNVERMPNIRKKFCRILVLPFTVWPNIRRHPHAIIYRSHRLPMIPSHSSFLVSSNGIGR